MTNVVFAGGCLAEWTAKGCCTAAFMITFSNEFKMKFQLY